MSTRTEMIQRQADASKGNILIVDDTPANLRLLSQMLTEQGYQVRLCPMCLSCWRLRGPSLRI